MCVAYRLLEDHGSLKPGDSVILNAANSTVGTCVIQLCRMLKLRAIAVVRDPGNAADLDKLVARLKGLGAAEVRALPRDACARPTPHRRGCAAAGANV
jgi:trans-2-enoyl-CoA reductase